MDRTDKFEYIVTKEDEGKEYSRIVRSKFSFSGRLLTKIKQQKLVSVNGQAWEKMYLKAKEGDVVSVKLPEEESYFLPEDIPISIIYEDDDLLIINKDPWHVVHPTNGRPDNTIANGVMKYMLDSGQRFKIRFINRLDMNTSGVLAAAKNSHSQDSVTKQMAAGKVVKKYMTIVKGILEKDEGIIDAPLGKPDPERVQRGVVEGGTPAKTRYKVVEKYDAGYSLVEVMLETGRTHQIRVHMCYLGHPVIGDEFYGGEEPELIARQALHAAKLGFCHPVTNEFMDFEAEMPDDMKETIEKIKKMA